MSSVGSEAVNATPSGIDEGNCPEILKSKGRDVVKELISRGGDLISKTYAIE